MDRPHSSLDPVALLAEVRDAQAQLGNRVDRRAGSSIELAPQVVTVASFAERLGKTWETGERRTIHGRPYVRRKLVPRRPSMLDPYVGRIEAWLVAEPHLTAVAIVDRLHECTPGEFGNKQLRTLQRFVKCWRAKTTKLLIDRAETMIAIESPAAVPAGTAAGQHVAVADAGLGNIAA